MVTMNIYTIIHKRKGRGENISEIFRAAQKSRNTVRKYYHMDEKAYLRYTERASSAAKYLSRSAMKSSSYIS